MARRIKGITIEIGGETTKLEKSLQSVYDKSKGLTREMKEVNRALKFNPKNIELTAQKQSILKEQVENTRKRLTELKGAQEQVNEQFRKGEIGEEQYRAFQREIVETESILKAYERQLSEVSDKHKLVGKSMEEIGGKMQDVGKKMQDVGKNLTMKVTAPIVGVAAAASKLGIDFEKSMSEVQAVSGATGDELNQLESAAREAGSTTDKSASEAAEALKYMALAGWDVEQSQKALMPMLKLSSAANMDLGRTSDLVTDTMSVLNLEIEDLDNYLDVLAQTSRNSNTDVDQLGESFLVVGGKLTQLGVDVEEGAVALGLLADNGIKGSEAGRGLNAVLTNLTAPTGRAKEALKELGISAFDSNGEFIGIEETLQLVEDATSGMTQENQNLYLSMIAGKEHSKTLNALMGELGTGFDGLSENVAGADGALEEMYDTATDNTMGALNELRSSVEELGLKLFENLQPAIEKITSATQGLVDKFNALTPKQQETIVEVGLMVAALGPALLIFGKLTGAVGSVIETGGKLIGNWDKIAGAGGALASKLAGTVGFIFSPTGAIVLGIAAIVAGGVGLVKHLKKDAIPTVNLFGDEVSDSTAQAVGAFFDMTEDANTALKELAWSQQEVTAEMAEDMQSKQKGITDNLLSAIENRHEQESAMMKEQFANMELLSDESKEKALVRLDEHYGEEYGKTKEAHKRINEIIATAEAEGREIRSHEAKEIEKIRGDMNNQAVEMMSESALEQQAILEQMKVNSATITAQEAAEVVRNATEKKDAVLQEANNQYDETVAWAIQQRDETGILSREEADAVIFNAKLERDEAVGAAEEMHEKVVAEAQAQAGEHVNEVDWTTGEILSKWDILSNRSSEIQEKMGKAVKEHFQGYLKRTREDMGDIARTVKNNWNEAKESTKTDLKNIGSAIRTHFSDYTQRTKDDFGEIVNTIKGNWGSAITRTGTQLSELGTSISTKWGEIKTSASTKWNEIKTSITSPIIQARNAVKTAIDKMKGYFNFNWRLPKIKMPRFSVSGSANPLNWLKEGVPKLSVSWHADGGILTRPGIFGMMGNTLLAGGEHRTGGEAILPLNRLPQIMADAMDRVNRTQKQNLNPGNNDVLIEGDTYEIHLTVNGDLPDSTIKKMAGKIEQEIKNINDRKRSSRGERVSFG